MFINGLMDYELVWVRVSFGIILFDFYYVSRGILFKFILIL